MKNQAIIFEPEIINPDTYFTLEECCHTTKSPQSFIIELISEDIIQPQSDNSHYKFTLTHIQKIKKARSFYVDLGINLQGIALALDLLSQIEMIERQSV
jgi:chaperone modulatory protein CbpM